MGPKKPPPKKADGVAPTCGIMIESPLPVWEDGESEKDNWGDLSTVITQQTDTSSFYCDPDANPPNIHHLQEYVGEWKRPHAIFSPFKPVVFRPVIRGHPYEFDPAAVQAVETGDDDDAPRPTTKEEMIELYRTMKPFRSASAEEQAQSQNRRSNTGKKKDKVYMPTPPFMRAISSALMVLNHNQKNVPQGSYAWELIFPQTHMNGIRSHQQGLAVALSW